MSVWIFASCPAYRGEDCLDGETRPTLTALRSKEYNRSDSVGPVLVVSPYHCTAHCHQHNTSLKSVSYFSPMSLKTQKSLTFLFPGLFNFANCFLISQNGLEMKVHCINCFKIAEFYNRLQVNLHVKFASILTTGVTNNGMGPCSEHLVTFLFV